MVEYWSTDDKGWGSKSNGWIDRLIEKDQKGRKRGGITVMEVFRSSVVTDLKSVTTKTGEGGSKMTPLSTKFV